MINSSRIPASECAGFDSWSLPEVREGQVIQAEKTRKRIAAGDTRGLNKSEVLYKQMTAGQLQELTEKIHQDIYADSFEQARREGLEAGHREGLAAGQQQVQQQSAQLAAVCAQLVDVLHSQDQQLEQALVNLTVNLSRAVLQRELSIDSSHVLQLVQQAVATLPADSAMIRISLNPQDFQLLSEHSQVPENWQLFADGGVSAGGCRVVNEYSVVDFTLEEQFQQAVNTLVADRYGELTAVNNPQADDNSGGGNA